MYDRSDCNVPREEYGNEDSKSWDEKNGDSAAQDEVAEKRGRSCRWLRKAFISGFMGFSHEITKVENSVTLLFAFHS